MSTFCYDPCGHDVSAVARTTSFFAGRVVASRELERHRGKLSKGGRKVFQGQ